MKRNLKHSKKVLIWTFTWLISFAILVVGPKELWENTTITIFAALVNFILIIAMLFANKNQFDGFDEFEKTVQLNAIALSLFLTIFVGLFFTGVYQSGLIKYEPQIHHLIVFSSLTYIFSTIFIFKKYQ
ncbi:hypothetical protein OAK23_00625 [Flavobacteriaceae bacterium]|jgi:hypothetical protein|nr:hypothetical protein [Flavobacteriaceae bacterium]|tara:strand:+ start:82 stop:468 length:387 start_codon:yes stop_codon:yes gene_type:complete